MRGRISSRSCWVGDVMSIGRRPRECLAFDQENDHIIANFVKWRVLRLAKR